MVDRFGKYLDIREIMDMFGIGDDGDGCEETDYIPPLICESCGSPNIAVRVWNYGGEVMVGYVCKECGEMDLLKHHNGKSTQEEQWEKKVLDIHKKCHVCGSTDGLKAHRIIPGREYAYKVTNGVALFRNCLEKINQEQ